ncbi:MAG: flagellar biosynthetic protein FliQ [Spirochaetaceae bacterium]|nr:MAG: flagellar biosynthetic protein FliQ [Spirochaetaceae bacterium]
MDFGFAVNIVRTAVLYIILVSAPTLLIGMSVGLVISIFQATTSIQEQTLTFVPKIVAILGAVVLFGPWMLRLLVQFTVNIINQIPLMIR